MTTIDEIWNDPTVQRWAVSAKWADEPERERIARMELLQQFCKFSGRTPTEIVEACLKPDDALEGREISIKGRRETNEQINEFQETLPGTLFMRALGGNTIRSFLIHNGVLIQAPPVI